MSAWIEKGGPVVWPLLALSLVSATVVIERALFWMRAHAHPDGFLVLARSMGIEAVERRMARGMALLDTTITIAPMLGILGTVLGIIDSFERLSAGSGGDPMAISGGIAEALITTAIGLVVALATILPFNWFRARIRDALGDLELAVARGAEQP